MRNDRSLIVLAGALIALSNGVFAQETATETGTTPTAAELIGDAQRAVGQVVKAARADTTLEPDASDAKPFWNAMKELNEALDKADTGLTLEDETFFSNLALVTGHRSSNASRDSAESALDNSPVNHYGAVHSRAK